VEPARPPPPRLRPEAETVLQCWDDTELKGAKFRGDTDPGAFIADGPVFPDHVGACMVTFRKIWRDILLINIPLEEKN